MDNFSIFCQDQIVLRHRDYEVGRCVEITDAPKLVIQYTTLLFPSFVLAPLRRVEDTFIVYGRNKNSMMATDRLLFEVNIEYISL